MDQADRASFEIPGFLGFGGGIITFSRDNVQFKSKTIPYKDAISICYQATKISINLIPTTQEYTYKLKSDSDKLSFRFSTALFIRNKKVQEAYMKLIYLSQQLIEPLLVQKLLHEVFYNNKNIRIGNVTINKQGYSIERFIREPQHVSWSERIYKPEFHQGTVILFKDKNGEASRIGDVSMDTDNAVLLPELIVRCFYQSKS